MSSGFLALNNSNQVLVSSDTRNLHLVTKITTPSEVVLSNDNYGGVRIWKYRVSCPVYPVPFFTMPTTDFYGVTRITSVSDGVWDIELIRSGTATSVPTVYVFADPRAATPSETFGMVVYRDDGTPAFDSRLRPLVVAGGLNVSQPSNPRPTFPYGLDPKYCASSESDAGGHFAPTESNTYSLSGQPSTPMFFYASLAQAERQANYSASETDCLGSNKLGICITKTTYDWNSSYWAFYRGGISWNGSQLNAGWIVVAWGCNWNYNQDDSLIGIGIGGDSGGGGTWPYSNETINLSSSSVITADSTRYD